MDKTQNCGLTWRYTNKNGYIFDVPKFKKYSKGLREQSFGYMGPKLFNSLPLYLRLDNEQSIESWKEKLGKFPEEIPDNPITTRCQSGLCDAYTSKSTNSLIWWIPFLHLSGKRDRGDFDFENLTTY